ncbi:MAG: NRDE family protein [Burkholderiaceae bacterium]
MCLMVLAWRSHPDYPLILAANRDEFYLRRTRPAAWWGHAVSVLAGHDEEAGGTWLGITRRGRFAALTNVRAPSERNPHAPSRGTLVLSALQSPQAPAAWLQSNAPRMGAYNGFNMLVGDVGPLDDRGFGPEPRLDYYSNRKQEGASALQPGVYGLSNADLDTPWPKVTRAVVGFACAIASRVDVQPLLHLLANRELARDAELPSTGVPHKWERALSPIQIRANGYGTRSSTVLAVRNDGHTTFFERSFDPIDPERFSDRHYEFMIDRAASPVRIKAPGSG